MQLKPVRTIARIVVLTSNGEVLLMQRSASDRKGASEWEVPGGSVETGEDHIASAQRELAEEVGISVNPSDLSLVHVYSGDFGHGQRNLLFFVLAVDAKPPVKLSHEHDDYQWVRLNEAANRTLFQHHEQALAYIQQNMLA